MHGTLCAGLDHEDGNMWCLICRKPAGLIDPPEPAENKTINMPNMNVDHDSGCIQSESGCGVNSDGWCFFLDKDSDGNTWCIMCGNAGGANVKPAGKPTVEEELEPAEQEERLTTDEGGLKPAAIDLFSPNSVIVARQSNRSPPKPDLFSPNSIVDARDLMTDTEKNKRKDPRARRKLTNEQRLYIIQFLAKHQDGKGRFNTGAVEGARKFYGTSASTIFNIWKKYRDSCDEHGIGGNYQRNYSKCGRKFKDQGNLLDRIKDIPDDNRRTIRTAGFSIGIPKTTLHRLMKNQVLVKENCHAKPALNRLNKMRRISYVLEHIDGLGMFVDSYSDVHIDEKWFDMFKVKRGVIKHPGEKKSIKKCQSKSFVQKIMFLCAVARPRFDTASKSWFNGLIGCWAFTEVKEAERTSYRRPKGTLETVGIKSVTNVEHERMLVDNVIPAIKAKFPTSRKNRPIYIQMDNVKPHTIRVDKLIEEQCRKDEEGWDI